MERSTTGAQATSELSQRTTIRSSLLAAFPPVRTVAVIPAYNESSTIGSVIDGTSRYVDEVVVVDDGSSDDTAAIAREHGAHVVTHVFNTGVGGAVRTGYQYAIRHDYDFVVQVDADGQHDPEKIPTLLDHAEDADRSSQPLEESIDDSLIMAAGNDRLDDRRAEAGRHRHFRRNERFPRLLTCRRCRNPPSLGQPLSRTDARAAQRGADRRSIDSDAEPDEGESQFRSTRSCSTRSG